ncbi:DUF2812 domain-containing protein [Clostridium sp.]|jgi:hypothetical protein|uniref:DUF2812 domain-containing protein n=1 Tax=Clostridium sp. TaxID=1506 RepID=UPI003EEE44AC
MKVFKIFMNNLKEEVWVKKMAGDGWLIDKIGFGYTFREVEKKQYNLVMDYRMFTNKEEFEAYISLYEDFGWKHIAGSKSSGSQYFVHEQVENQVELFSDEDSQKARIIRIRKMLRQVLTITLVFFITLLSSRSITIEALMNPKKLYLTPGLWGMTGNTFWSAFWLETPFVLFRGILMYALPIIIIIYIVFSYKIQHGYNKALKKLK